MARRAQKNLSSFCSDMKQIKTEYHIGTLIHKNDKVCDPDPLICHQISDTDESHFLFYPLTCQKTGKKKADSAVSAAFIAREKSRASSHCDRSSFFSVSLWNKKQYQRSVMKLILTLFFSALTSPESLYRLRTMTMLPGVCLTLNLKEPLCLNSFLINAPIS